MFLSNQKLLTKVKPCLVGISDKSQKSLKNLSEEQLEACREVFQRHAVLWRDDPSKYDNGNVAVANAFKDLVRLAGKKGKPEKKEEKVTPTTFIRNLIKKNA